MVPSVAADGLGQMVLRIEADGRLRAANDTVLRFMREHRIETLWGRGLFASADMMSLEATRHTLVGTARPTAANLCGPRFGRYCKAASPAAGWTTVRSSRPRRQM
jgi:Tn3 transposase DDE domain